MESIPTPIPGCFQLQPRLFIDNRGTFLKTFHRETFLKMGLVADFPEQFFSTSRKGVLRGLHFQTPPAAHVKLISCLAGSVLDVVVDLRRGSPTFGKHAMFDLSAENASLLYVPVGLAHGFYTLSDSATVLYNVSTMHSPPNDTGIRWNSANIPWPDPNPILSPRDAAFPSFAQFKTPFTF